MTAAAIFAWLRSTWLGKALSAVLVGLVVVWGAYTAGKVKGAQTAADKASAATLDAMRDRREIDQIVREATDADLTDALSRD